MSDRVILLSVPGLRAADLAQMPQLSKLMAAGERVALSPGFPAVTCPVQANMTTGTTARDHGVIANGFYYRDKHEVEMWTAWNECIQRPQIWDKMHEHRPDLKSAVWFPLHSKGCGADYICTPAPIHNPDGSESLWCYTKPAEMYGELRDALGHFPLMNFWGPLANFKSTQWIMDSAVHAAQQFHPDFFYIYLPHLDYAAQKAGPDSDTARAAVLELDAALGKFSAAMNAAFDQPPLWIIASEYTILPVNHVSYPNRFLRAAGLLKVKDDDGTEQLDLVNSQAWALVDHQLSHIFVKDADPLVIEHVVELFREQEGVAEVLVGEDLKRYEIDHPRAGEVVLISTPNSWQAYYWWMDDTRAPKFARTVDIHRKPGYDPVEMHLDFATKSIPLDATLVKGSHGAPARDESQRGVILSSQPGVLAGQTLADTDVFGIVLKQFGI